jgi:uncharacterized membrane protein YhaH (DUF805 family)
MSRRNFLISQGTLTLVLLVIGIYSIKDGIDYSKLELFIILLLTGFIFQFICSFRRLHDINRPGIWALLIFVPYLSLPLFLYISYKAGDTTPNDHGNPDTRRFIDSLLNR